MSCFLLLSWFQFYKVRLKGELSRFGRDALDGFNSTKFD